MSNRWRYQYQRIADVLQQSVDKLTPDPHAKHRRSVRADGSCSYCDHIKKIVDEAPPLTSDQIFRLSALLPPLTPEEAAAAGCLAATLDARRAAAEAAQPRLRSTLKENSK